MIRQSKRFRHLFNKDKVNEKDKRAEIEIKIQDYILNYLYSELIYLFFLILVALCMVALLIANTFCNNGIIPTFLGITFILFFLFVFLLIRGNEVESALFKDNKSFKIIIYSKICLIVHNTPDKFFLKRFVYDKVFHCVKNLIKSELNFQSLILQKENYYLVSLNNLNNLLANYKNRNQLSEAGISKYCERLDKLISAIFHEKNGHEEQNYNQVLYAHYTRLFEIIDHKSSQRSKIIVTITLAIIVTYMVLSEDNNLSPSNIYSVIGTTITLLAIVFYFWDNRAK